jgi:GMP synthase (glutamine-hydrolysing)
MRKIMVVQHVGHEPLGTLNPMLKAAGFRIRYVNFGRDPDHAPSLHGYRGLIVLGGPMGVYEADKFPHLKHEMTMIEDALKRNLPVLGICLGSQLLAHVLGAKVAKAKTMEIGWLNIHRTDKPDPLFGDYAATEKVFQLHQDTFEIPKDAVQLARSDLFEGQAFRYGEKAYGLQFHLEVDKAMIHRWLKIAENIEMLERSKGMYSAAEITSATEVNIARNLELAEKTFAKFIEIFQLPERPILLGSDHTKAR